MEELLVILLILRRRRTLAVPHETCGASPFRTQWLIPVTNPSEPTVQVSGSRVSPQQTSEL